jgi:hypothetical protein
MRGKHRAKPTAPLKTVIDNRGGPRRRSIEGSSSTVSGTGANIIVVRVPLSVSQRGGRKVIITPSGGPAWAPTPASADNTLIHALARAHRWKRMLETGEFASMTELAVAEKVTESYLARILRLTLLSPKIVEAVLDSREAGLPQLQQLVRPFSTMWRQQETTLLTPSDRQL